MHQSTKYQIGEIIHLLKNTKIAIYGTGFIASRFVAWMQEQGIQENISCFIMTAPDKKIYMEKKVIHISEYRTEDGLLCIAVHESIFGGIKTRLQEMGITDFLWISPYIWELELGVGMIKKMVIKTGDIMRMHEHDYSIAIRYLAILEFYGKISFGYEIYQRGIGLYAGKETSIARLDQFIRLIRNWEKNGYDTHSEISVGVNNYLIDGAHRFSLAKYHNLKEIECLQYRAVVQRTGEVWDRAYIRENVLEDMCLEDHALDAVKKTQEYLLSG